MIKNYLSIAIRVLLKNKVYVVINLLSLGFAMACCIIAYLNYNHAEDFDNNHNQTQHVYRINSFRDVDGRVEPWALTPLPLAENVKNNFAGVENFARLHPINTLVKINSKTFAERIHYTDKSLFSFFNLPLKYGSINNFEDNTVVISEAFAKKSFGNTVPLGEELIIVNAKGEEEIFVISAVLAKIPSNSSFQFDIITSFEHLVKSGTTDKNDWRSSMLVTTFVKVNNDNVLKDIEAQLNPFVATHNSVNEMWKVERFYFQPFKEIAFSSDRDFSEFVNGSTLKSNPRGVIVIVPALMSIFILFITCFNFINISISFANSRLKEIGIRKVFGSRQKQLIKQFLTENLILCYAAALIAIVVVSILLPKLNSITGLALSMSLFENFSLLFFLVALPFVTALISGMYPAVFISSFKPLSIIRGKTNVGTAGRLTRFLLTAQFSLSCLAIIVGIMLSQNASYQDEVDFGYDLDQLVFVEVDNEQDYTAFSNVVRQNPTIEKMGGAVHHIGDWTYGSTVRDNFKEMQAQVAHIEGEDYLNTVGVELVEGRHFHPGNSMDTDKSIIVNETFVKQLNISAPVGHRVALDSVYFTIVGVVKDYKQYGLHGTVPPCVLRKAAVNDMRYIAVRCQQKDLKEVNAALESAWYKVISNKVYRGFLQTEMIEKERYLNAGFKSVALFLAFVTLLLSASGLFSLVSLNIVKRKREIGMRKVLGASIMQIIWLVNKDLNRIMLIAYGIGSVLGFMLVDKLIFKFIFVYHPVIGPESFLITFCLMALSCSLTVGFKVFKAAAANPVKALRNE